jgi:hypothetical protein
LAGRLADRSTAPLRGPAYSTIFSLLFGLGLRVGRLLDCVGETSTAIGMF